MYLPRRGCRAAQLGGPDRPADVARWRGRLGQDLLHDRAPHLGNGDQDSANAHPIPCFPLGPHQDGARDRGETRHHDDRPRGGRQALPALHWQAPLQEDRRADDDGLAARPPRLALTSGWFLPQGKSAATAPTKTATQPVPVFALMRRGMPDGWADLLKTGGRKIDAWYATLNVVKVGFEEEPEAFSTIHTREELHTWENAPPP